MSKSEGYYESNVKEMNKKSTKHTFKNIQASKDRRHNSFRSYHHETIGDIDDDQDRDSYERINMNSPRGNNSKKVSSTFQYQVQQGRVKTPINLNRESSRQIPMLNIILMKMEGKMKEYCELLSHPTSRNYCFAIELLTPKRSSSTGINIIKVDEELKSDASSQSPASHPTNYKLYESPDSSTSNSPSTPKQRYKLTLSPKRLRLFSDIAQSWSWSPSGKRGAVEDGDGRFQSALEAEWEKFVSPLVLLAGAEALFARLEHIFVESSNGELDSDDNRDSDDSLMSASSIDGTSPHIRNRVNLKSRSHSTCCNGAFASFLTRPKKGMFVEDANTGTSNNSNKNYQKHVFRNEKDRENCKIKLKKLLSMYKNVAKEITLVKEILCDPIMDTTGGDKNEGAGGLKRKRSKAQLKISKPLVQSSQEALSNTPHDSDFNHSVSQTIPGRNKNSQPQRTTSQAASSLNTTLNAILLITSARCKLISIHTDLFFSKSFSKVDSISSLVSDMSLNADVYEDYDDLDDSNMQPKFLLQISQRCHALLSTFQPITIDGKGNKDDLYQCGAAIPMVNALKHEIKAFLAAITACQSVNQCRFYETIILVRKLKVHLSPTSPLYCFPPTPLHIWLHFVLSNILSKMSIYFDRIEAYSSHTYNFRTPASFESDYKTNSPATDGDNSNRDPINQGPHERKKSSKRFVPIQDYDGMVLDFLRRHESRGGSIMAVAVILDAKVGSKPYFERGFMSASTEGGQKSTSDENSKNIDTSSSCHISDQTVDGLRSWPAIYLRTTRSLQSTRQCNDNCQNSGLESNPSKRMMNFPITSFSSVAAHSQSHGIGEQKQTHASKGEYTSTNRTFLDKSSKCSEYWPASEETSWPLVEWPNIISFLIQNKIEPSSTDLTNHIGMGSANLALGPYIYREAKSEHATFESKTASLEAPTESLPKSTNHNERGRAVGLFSHLKTNSLDFNSSGDPNSSSVSNISGIGSTQHLTSIYYASQIDSQSWLVITFKEEEERRFRRSPGLTDGEIQIFLNKMCCKLRSDHLFFAKTVAKARQESHTIEKNAFTEPSLVPSFSLTNLNSGIGRLDKKRKDKNQKDLNANHLKHVDETDSPLWNQFLSNSRNSNVSNEWKSTKMGEHLPKEHWSRCFS